MSRLWFVSRIASDLYCECVLNSGVDIIDFVADDANIQFIETSNTRSNAWVGIYCPMASTAPELQPLVSQTELKIDATFSNGISPEIKTFKISVQCLVGTQVGEPSIDWQLEGKPF